MQQIVFKMLPENDWQVARIIRFRYTHLERPCNATIVYFLPFELYDEKHNCDLVDKCIIEGLKTAFGDINLFKREIFFNNVRDEMSQVYDGGRPIVSLTLRMTPEIPTEEINKYVGKELYGYDFCLNIHLDYLGKIERYSNEMLITIPYPINDIKDIEWGATAIETL